MREYLRKQPMLGWALAAVLMLVAAYSLWRNFQSGDIAQLTQNVTIRCSETGETWQVPRGVIEKQLYQRPYPVNPNEGLINPKTGKATGFPVDDWKQTIERINNEIKALQPNQSQAPPSPSGN